MNDLTAAVVGLGMMGRNHVRALQQLDGVRLTSVVDPAQDLPRMLTTGARFVSTLDELLASPPDFCVVAVPTDHHHDVCVRLAQAGVHTLVEKPVAATVEEAVSMDTAFRNAGVLAAVGHVERYNPAVRSLRDRISEGQVGEILQVSTRRQGPFPSRVTDVGVVRDLATHDLDLTMFITGATYEHVSAEMAFRSGRPNEDLVAAVGRLDDGTVVNHLVNWLSPVKERIVVVLGTRGALVADTLTMDLTFYENGVVKSQWDAIAQFRGVAEGDATRYALAKPEPLALELATFRDAIAHGDASKLVSLSEGIRTLEVADAILQAGDHAVHSASPRHS